MALYTLLVILGAGAWLLGRSLRNDMKKRVAESPLINMLSDKEMRSYKWRSRVTAFGWIPMASCLMHWINGGDNWISWVFPVLFSLYLVWSSYIGSMQKASQHIALREGKATPDLIVLIIEKYYQQDGLLGLRVTEGSCAHKAGLQTPDGRYFSFALPPGKTYYDVLGAVIAKFGPRLRELWIELGEYGVPAITTDLSPQLRKVT